MRNSLTKSEVMSWGRKSLTSATLPRRPIMFRSRALLSENLSLHWRNNRIPPPSKNLLQLMGVSSVTFHMVDQACSNTSSHVSEKYKLHHHTIRNLHFLSKNSTLICRENCRFFGLKTRENVVVLDFLAVENFDFTRKIVKKNLGKKFVKMLWFLTF